MCICLTVNQVTPAPSTKHFTDEELKQQYGIHLASRIQADDGDKQNKWADIDDDEDDWAPETVVWMDGTKSTIKADPILIEPQKPIEMPSPLPTQTTEIQPVLTPLVRASISTASGPPKTILKPGLAQQAKKDTSTGGTAKDSQALSANKTPAPAPTKSPWAPIPQIDRSIPLFEPVSQDVGTAKRLATSQDARVLDSGSINNIAHEMEADTFDRSWKDSEKGPRELFNSQSGRYEPAPANRRGSMRQDTNHKTASVLRRPSQEIHEHTTVDRNAQMDGSPWARRRGSSNAGSNGINGEHQGSALRNLTSMDNRNAIVIGHDIGPQPRKESVDQIESTQADERNAQRKIMLAKKEAAIQRRREEEEREQADRRERIRQKLEALGPAAVAPSRDVNPVDDGKSSRQSDVISHSISPVMSKLSSVNEPTSTSRKEGEQELPNKGGAHRSASASTSHVDRASAQHIRQVSAGQSSREQAGSHAFIPSVDQPAPTSFKSPALSTDSFATWGNRPTAAGSTHPNSVSNVWGPPGAVRHIGNGAFDSGYNRVQTLITGSAGNLYPAQQLIRTPISARQQDTSPMRHQQMLNDQNMLALGLVDTPIDTYSPSTLGDHQGQNMLPIAPIGPPQPRQIPQPSAGQQAIPQRGAAVWNYAAQVQQAEIEQSLMNAVNNRQHQQQVSDYLSQEVHSNQQRWKETFKQTKVSNDWTGGKREVIRTEQIYYGVNPQSQQNPAPPMTQSQPTAPSALQQSHENTVRLPNASSVKTTVSPSQNHTPTGSRSVSASYGQHSRFFPTGLYGSSPPPEEYSHPVFNGNISHPTVHLPTPKANVRLPPSSRNNPIESPVIMPHRSSPFRSSGESSSEVPDWQAKINGLFVHLRTSAAAPPSPPKTPPKTPPNAFMEQSLAPQSASKVDIFDTLDTCPIHISLPMINGASRILRSESIDVKPTVDDLFDEELSFGSTPTVVIPRNPNYQTNQNRSGIHILRMTPHAKFDRPIESVTVDGFAMSEQKYSITVHLPFSIKAPKDLHIKEKAHARYREKSNRTPQSASSSSKGQKANSDEKESKHTPRLTRTSKPNSRKASRQNSPARSRLQVSSTNKVEGVSPSVVASPGQSVGKKTPRSSKNRRVSEKFPTATPVAT